MRKWLVVLVAILMVVPILGANFKKGKLVEVSNISGDLYATGGELIAKEVDGDVLFFGRKARLWNIQGGVFFFGEKLVLNGAISRSVRFFGRSLEVNGNMGRDVLFAGQELRIEKGAVVEGEVYAAGEEIDIYGQVNGKVSLAGNEVVLGGVLNSDARIKAKNIIFLPEAKIQGKLEYWAPKQIEIPQGVVAGEVVFHKYSGKKVQKKAEKVKKEVEKEAKAPAKKKRGFLFSGLWFKVSWFISSLVLGYILFLLFPSLVKRLKEEILSKPVKAFLLGAAEAVAFIILILAFFVIVYTWLIGLIGIPIFLIGLYFAKLLAAFALGAIVLKWIFKKEITLWISYPVGLILLILISLIPYVGWLFCLVLRLWGFGGFLYKVKI